MNKLLAFLLLVTCALLTAEPKDIDFKAERYTRDLGTNTLKLKGNAWLRIGSKQIWADEIEEDFTANRATANGNVRIFDGPVKMWARHASYYFATDEATLEEATLLTGQILMTGSQLRRLGKKQIELDEGTYSNCNIGLIKDKEIAKCHFDWKIYGRSFSVTIGGYAHVRDALVYAKQLPVLYAPYFVVPIKTERQSGLLYPYFIYTGNLGSGFTLPYFAALGKWHDLTIRPTFFSKTGYYVGLNYRYLYSREKYGAANFYFTQRFFGPPENPESDPGVRGKALGLIGEWAVVANNTYALGGRSHTRQLLQLVSNPYYAFDYSFDLGPQAQLYYMRSQINYTRPSDETLLTAQIQHLQPLIVSLDRGVDQGPVTQLPRISFEKTTSSFLSSLFSWEFSSEFTNFYRPDAYDSVPPIRVDRGLNLTTRSNFLNSDYIRTGRRLQIEPRLIANVPMPQGFQFQPLFRAGTLLYHFDVPSSELVHREYSSIEFPLSLYLSRNFSTNISGYEKLSHVMQPRVVVASSLAQSSDPDHPFFARAPAPKGLPMVGNPRFDLTDQVLSYGYARFEFINRFRRRYVGGIERFFLLQVSNQYNFTPNLLDPRYQNQHGPIEILSELKLGRFTSQIQFNYQLDKNYQRDPQGVRENSWSSTFSYQAANNDVFSVNLRLSTNVDPTLSEQVVTAIFYKKLPVFFNIGGNAEYSMQGDGLRGYQLGLYFGSKPRSCWSLGVVMGQNSVHLPFASIQFKLDFGTPGGLPKI